MSGLGSWAAAAALALGLAAALLGVRGVFAGRVRGLAARTASGFDDLVADLIDRTHPLSLLALAVWAVWTWTAPALGLGAGPLPHGLGTALLVVAFVQVGRWAGRLVELLAERRRRSAARAGHPGDATAWTALSVAARIAVWSIVALLALDNLGIDVTALVAGLGIGGIAIGLALQSVLGDIMASLAILLDRPFVVGDFVVFDDVMGTVEHIGLKTTRLRALSGEQIVLANAQLLLRRIHNFQRMEERRVVVSFGVAFETPAPLLARIPSLCREVLEDLPGTRLDRAHLCRLGESSVDFELVYFLADPDYNRHMDVQQAVLLGLFQRLGALGIGFAYPTRTLHHRWRADLLPPAAVVPPVAPTHPPTRTSP